MSATHTEECDFWKTSYTPHKLCTCGLVLAFPPAPDAERLVAELLTLSCMATFAEDDFYEMSNWIDEALPCVARSADTITALTERLATAEAENAALKAEVERKREALEIGRGYIIRSNNRWQDDDLRKINAALLPKEAHDGR